VYLMAWFVALIIAAMIFFLLEILTPTFGAMAGLGLASLGGAVWMAFFIHPVFGLVVLILTIVWVPAYLVLVVRVLPKTALGQHLFLGRARKATGDAAPEIAKHESLVGKSGITDTLLRPTGAVRIDGQRVIAAAEHGTIPKGTRVKVIGATATNVIVRPIEEA